MPAATTRPRPTLLRRLLRVLLVAVAAAGGCAAVLSFLTACKIVGDR